MKVGFGPQISACGLLASAGVVVARISSTVGVLVVDVLVVAAGVEQAGVLRADRQRQIVLDGVQEDEVAQDVALDRLHETPGRCSPAA